MSSKLIQGAFILTVGSVLSKVLGALYVIPFNMLLGTEGAGLYSYSYIPYSIFISISTAGIPLALSKSISKYNSLEEYKVSQQLFRASVKLMLITGILSFLGMYTLAPFLANISSDGGKGFAAEDITTVMRAVSFALIIIPCMSVFRGYFQGHSDMKPTAISQVIEQLVRIGFLLMGAFVVIKVLDGSIVTAVSVATFAAAVGAVGGSIVLWRYWKKDWDNRAERLKRDKSSYQIQTLPLFKEILVSSFPFVMVGISMSMFQLVDNLTFTRAMVSIGQEKEAIKSAFGILMFNTQKLVLIPNTLATSLSIALIPAITSAYMKKDSSLFQHQLTQSFQGLFFIMIPAVMGMSVLASPLYTAFYEFDGLGGEVLAAYAPAAILFALFSVTAAVLQGTNYQKYTVLSLLTGFLCKLAFNIPLIQLFETRGAVYATTLGYLVTCLMNLYCIHYFTGYRFHLVVKRIFGMFVISGIMCVVVLALESLLGVAINMEDRLGSILIVFICAVIGAVVYGYLAYRTGLLNKVFEGKLDGVMKRFRLLN
ncbi:putative polysaccharide biosynthesis protein [Pradoshia sp.]